MYSIADFVITLFVRVDDAIKNSGQTIEKDRRAKLWPSELLTLGMLHAIKGKNQSAFYRWAFANLRIWFPNLPERTRLFRLLAKYQQWADQFLADSEPVGYADSLGIELIHPRREGRSSKQIGKKGKSNHRWIVGIKYCPFLTARGRIRDWDAEGANTHDGAFQRILNCYQDDCKDLFVDSGFHRSDKRGGDGKHLRICKRGENNIRMMIETMFSVWVGVFGMKKITNRTWLSVEARLNFASAAYNLLMDWTEQLSIDAKKHIGIAEIVCL